MPLARRLFPNAEIIIDRFHIIQHLGRAFLKTRIAIMNQFDKKSLPYRSREFVIMFLESKLVKFTIDSGRRHTKSSGNIC